MLSVGTNVKSASEPLKKIPLEYLYNALRNPKPEMASRISQLRIVRQMSAEQYSKLKQQLPYFVCAAFNPPFRRTENFAYTEHFVIDIDHIGDKGLSVTELKSRIMADSRTLLCFLSPGQDGLKVLMRLKEKCYDPGVYSVFYKKFVYEYSIAYGLQQVVDSKTSDVARACFMSVDSDAYYNPNADVVDMNAFIPAEDPAELLRFRKEVEASVAEIAESAPPQTTPAVKASDPDEDSMAKIRELLAMRPKRVTQEKTVYVPEVLNEIAGNLVASVGEVGLDVYEILNIQYGKKIRARLGLKKAEVNLFYGHRGFSVVLSPKTGTDPALNQLLADAVNSYLAM